MNFAEAWVALVIGDAVTVSDGTQQPDNTTGTAFFAWRSHNFTGTLIEQIDGDFRALKIEMAPDGDVTVAYTVSESVPHQFGPA